MSDFNSFAESARVASAYLEAKYAATTADQWHTLAMDARSVMRSIAREIEGIRATAPRTHGRATQARLEMQDVFREKAEAVFQNAIAARNKLQGVE